MTHFPAPYPDPPNDFWGGRARTSPRFTSKENGARGMTGLAGGHSAGEGRSSRCRSRLTAEQSSSIRPELVRPELVPPSAVLLHPRCPLCLGFQCFLGTRSKESDFESQTNLRSSVRGLAIWQRAPASCALLLRASWRIFPPIHPQGWGVAS